MRAIPRGKIIYHLRRPYGLPYRFYLLTRNMPHETAIQLTYDAMRLFQGFEGEIPGTASTPRSGNYKEHDLAAAKRDVAAIADAGRVTQWNAFLTITKGNW